MASPEFSGGANLEMSSNVRRIYYLVVLSAFFSALVFGDSAAAKQVTLGPYNTLDGKYEVTFDTSRISEEQMKQLVLLSPALSSLDYTLAPSLELCVTGDPRYRECGDRRLESPNFLPNAEVNLNLGRQALKFVSTLRYPKELQRVVRYLKDSLSFSLWIQEARYQFFKTWELALLKRQSHDIDPTRLCDSILKTIERTSSQGDKYQLTKDWWNCMNRPFRERLGDYPLEAWQGFLKAYGIEEGPAVKRLFLRATDLEEKRRYAEAKTLYERIIREYPEDIKEDEISSTKYSALALDRLNVMACGSKRSADFSTKEPQVLAHHIRDALLKKDTIALANLASCEFLVGVKDSDNLWSLAPHEAGTIILAASQRFDFRSSSSAKLSEQYWRLEFSDSERKESYVFGLKKIRNAWVWDSFTTSSSTLLDLLYAPKKKNPKQK